MDLFTQDWASCLDTSADPTGTGVAKLSCAWIALQNVINAALVLSALVAVFLIIYSGIQYVTSGGDKEKVDNARKRLTYAIIGLIVIIFSFAIVNFIAQFTGLDSNQLIQPPGSLPNVTPNSSK